MSEDEKQKLASWLANKSDNDLYDFSLLLANEILNRNSQKIKAIGPIPELDKR
jgi:hypothetical protein